jgi:peroxiredoxin
MRITLCLLSLSFPLCVFGAESPPDARPILGRPLGSFSAPDFRGRVWAEADFADCPVLVVAFFGVECPLAKQYGPRLQKIAADYAERGVRVLGVNANRHDSITELAAYARQHELKFPIVKDLNNVLADRWGAQRTPEVFVFDRDRLVRYRGRIDDQHAIGNKSKPAPSREELRAAIDDLLAGRDVQVAETEPVGCLIGRIRAPQAEAQVTYSKDVAPLLRDRCVECHRPGEIAPFSLTDYAEVAGWAGMIAEVTAERRMPPWHADPQHGRFANENRLTDAELALIRNWVAAGAPEGNPADLPPPKTYATGWQLDREPDRVFAMASRPFSVKAEGEVRYQYFSVDTDFDQDVWINAAEIVPGNRAVVHHVIVFAASDRKIVDDDRQMVTAYVPGLRVTPLPEGMAKKIAAGSKLIFQVHYTPIGTPQTDLTKVGLYFVDPQTVMHEVQTISTRTRQFRIEPMQDDQRFTSSPVTAPVDVLLLSLSPHMHLRGKSFRYEMTWPNGQTETLLDVPRYDFNWQTMYRLSEPLVVPRGSKLVAHASYDNSPNNLANPDPKATVTWGDQSWEEMMIGYADVAFERGTVDAANLAREVRRSSRPDVVGRLFKSLDGNNDGKIERTEVEERFRDRFDRIDGDKDGVVTRDEWDRGAELLRKLLGQ